MKSLGIFIFGVMVGAALLFVVQKSGTAKPEQVAATEPKIVPVQQPLVCPVCPDAISNDDLPPPLFSETLPPSLVTNRDGEVRVAWKEVKGAKSYVVHLENSKGKSIHSYRSSRTVLYLKEIQVPEGEREVRYQVKIATVNGLGVEGVRGEAKELLVKAMGSLTAPKVREIRVED